MKNFKKAVALLLVAVIFATMPACTSDNSGTQTTGTDNNVAITTGAGQNEKENTDMPTTDQTQAREKGYVIVSDYVQPNTGEDVSDELQKIIDDNPRKTIYFPDGEYLISKPISTSGNHELAVSLELSNFAIIKAMRAKWRSSQCMIRLGGKNPEFIIHENGTNNYISGGIIDGSNIAKGLSIEGAREYSVRYMSIKHVTQGIYVKYNKEYGSNDSDIMNVNIYGAGTKDSIGVLVEGFDNTFTNMRVANFQTGFKLVGAGNFMRNIHPLFIYGDAIDYTQSIGFDDMGGANWYDICYPDNFAVGFRLQSGTTSNYNNCYCYWYSSNGGVEIGFQAVGKFNAILTNCRVDFRSDTKNAYLKVGESGGGGLVQNPIFNTDLCPDENDYKDYLSGRVVWAK